MPPNPDLVAGSSSEASILLVEEYDALAVAIGSALRKFAPHHARRVAASLPEAQAIAEAVPLELVVIDLDPPQTGLVHFIEQLKTSQPTLRVLAIGCGISAKFAAARAGEGAIQFLEKPFELADFGKAIEAARGGAEAPDDARGGILADLDLADLIALGCVNGASSVLKLHATDGRSGEIHFAGGQLCHASAPGLTGEASLEEMLRWRVPHFSETDRPADAPRTINAPWDAVLIDALRKTGTRAERSEISRPRARPREAVARTGKKIVVIDDTELLLIFVEEILGTADPQLRISTAHTGTEGCRRAELSAPDLILLDYSLPDINGDEVCRRLLEDERTALIPIVMMSGHVPEMNATAQRFANVVATISKPFLSHELVTLVEKTLSEGPRAVLEIAKMKEPPSPERAAPKQKQHHGNGKGKGAPPTGESAPPSSPIAQAGPSIAAAIASAETESTGTPTSSASVLAEEPIIAPRISAVHLSSPISRGRSATRTDAEVADPDPVVPPLAAGDIRGSVADPESRISPFVPISKPTIEVMAPREPEPDTALEIQEPWSLIEEAPLPTELEPPTPLLAPLSFESPLASTSAKEVVVEPIPSQAAIEIVERAAAVPAIAVTLPTPKTVLVGFSLRTAAMQLTPSFGIERIRAQPTTWTVSLNLPPESSPLPTILQTGFDLDFVELNREGQIESVRLVPTHRALDFMPVAERELAVDAMAVGGGAVELRSNATSSMNIQLLSAFQIAAVELSPTFAVARLALKSISRRVRLTFDGSLAGRDGAIFETAALSLDATGRLAEIEMTPLS